LTGFQYDLMIIQKWLTFYWAILYVGAILKQNTLVDAFKARKLCIISFGSIASSSS